jgi:hypothetical protein
MPDAASENPMTPRRVAPLGVRPNTPDMSLLLEIAQKLRPSVHTGGRDLTAVTIETFGAISDNFQSLVTTSSDVNESLFVTYATRSVMIAPLSRMRRNGRNPSNPPGLFAGSAVFGGDRGRLSRKGRLSRRFTDSPSNDHPVASLLQCHSRLKSSGTFKHPTIPVSAAHLAISSSRRTDAADIRTVRQGPSAATQAQASWTPARSSL